MIIKLIFTFLIGFLATTIGAISGVGGGVIIKPVMDAVLSRFMRKKERGRRFDAQLTAESRSA